MLETFKEWPPYVQALLAGGVTWGLTALGASLVFFTRDVPRALMDALLGFSAGVMLAASAFSLLVPGFAFAEAMGYIPWLPVAVGFLAGGLFIRLLDYLLPHLHLYLPLEAAEGLSTHWKKTILLVLAITLHNLPEGLAVGVAFGAAHVGLSLPEGATLTAALTLSIGIGLQNIPEGMAVAFPLRREGISPLKAFWYGQLSALIEPIAAPLGAGAVMLVAPLLPYAMGFAAGAMIYVIVEELIPEAHFHGHPDIATLGLLLGFTVMMVLDVALG